MNVKELNPTIENLLEKMGKDGYSSGVLGTNRWILGHFAKYCEAGGIQEINMGTVASFLRTHYDIDYRETVTQMQTVVRRPLLVLMEYYECGSFLKSHQRGSTTEIPLEFKGFFLRYRDFINTCELTLHSKERKFWVMTNYLRHLVAKGICEAGDIELGEAGRYIESRVDLAPASVRIIAGTIREAYDWMHGSGMIAFSGKQEFPLIRKQSRVKLLSYYTREEVSRVLGCIDTSTPIGKRDFFLVSLIAYLGLRAGDVVNLKFSDIDWGNDTISFIQQKTGSPLSLPLIDEVKFPLLDYLKNARPDSADSDHVLITRHAPHTRYPCGSTIGRIVTKCMDKAGIDYEGRHHGAHSLRHSLAGGMINENVPLSAIANILGHADTRTTESYLTIDRTDLRKLSLEVPDVL
ncbi:MAG: tyrosine-type recombinase/integrase [Coriobacteriales bacterium]|jgi:integrase|nr:tyrosine-type recombinase/integrase [Coriobacteriales bacterium]